MSFATVVFDCDSTLSRIEGIDELAGAHAAEVRRLTDEAMKGTIALEAVYGRRLGIIRPTRERVRALGREYVDTLVPDARETVAALRFLGKNVRVLSGGLLPAVAWMGAELGLAEDEVAAVGIRFDEAGGYAGFDENSPLARSGGKASVLRGWALPRPALMVGDGATDLEARPAVDAFAAYMGVAFRDKVAAFADFVLRDPSLAPVVSIVADDEERARLAASPFAALLERGDLLLNQP
jgi:phosphoserine phosphatase